MTKCLFSTRLTLPYINNLWTRAIDGNSPHARLLRVGSVQGIENALTHFGCDVDAVFAHLELDRNMFSEGDQLVSLQDIGRLLEYGLEATQCPRLSFYLAETQDLSYLGTFGLLLQTAATVGEVLREVRDYHHIHIQAATWTLETTARTASLNFWVDTRDISAAQRRLIVELALAQAFTLIEAVTGNRAQLTKARLHFEYPAGRQAYRRFFRAPVEYNAESSGLDFPISLLDQPVAPSDAALHELILTQLSEHALSDRQQDIAQEVRVIIRTLLPTGQCTVERVAGYYSCDKRTLQRYLREESDTSYQLLLDEVRFDMVESYLRDSNMPMTQLAYVAGFTDASNFARAFRQRYGVSPRKWREEHSAPSAPLRKRRRSRNAG